MPILKGKRNNAPASAWLRLLLVLLIVSLLLSVSPVAFAAEGEETGAPEAAPEAVTEAENESGGAEPLPDETAPASEDAGEGPETADETESGNDSAGKTDLPYVKKPFGSGELLEVGEIYVDLESEEDWIEMAKSVYLMGDFRRDLIAMAAGQLGYTPGTRNYIVVSDLGTLYYTRYGEWGGSPYDKWCAMFVSFCLHYAGISEDVFPYESSCMRWVWLLEERNKFAPAGEYEPLPGDLIFFGDHVKGVVNHVGIVTEVEPTGVIHTIEGNHSKAVASFTYAPDDPAIWGYGILPADWIEEESADAADNGGGRLMLSRLGEPSAQTPAPRLELVDLH